MGYSFWKIDHDLSSVGLGFCEGVSESGYGDGIALGVERSDDGAFAAFCCG